MIFERIFRAFSERNLRYAVIGGIAVNLHGYNRVTGDLDIVISLDQGNVLKFIQICEDLELEPRFPVALRDLAVKTKRQNWVTEKNMIVFSVYNPSDPLEHVDVKIDTEDRIEGYIANADILEAGDLEIHVVNIDDLIALKTESGRERDLLDIRALQTIREMDEE